MNGPGEYFNEIGFAMYEATVESGTYDGTGFAGACGGPPPAATVMQSFAWVYPPGGNNWVRMCDNPFPHAYSEIDVGNGVTGLGH